MAVRVRGRAEPGQGEARASPGLADLTCVATGEGWLYLAAVMDLFSRKPDAERQSEIAGWAMSGTMPQEPTLAALNMAVANRKPGPGPLHRSDRGSRHRAHACRRVLDEHGMRRSMSRKGNCWDNAPMESFFGGLKTGLDGDGPFDTRQAARTALFRAIEGWRNRQRLHSSLGHMTPANKEQLAAAA